MSFEKSEEYARSLDKSDPLSGFRDLFHFPLRENGEKLIYFAGNSLGLQPKEAKQSLLHELEAWEKLGVKGHHSGRHPWYSYHEPLQEPMALIVGARPEEVVLMNSLTVNLHLMLISFYEPKGSRKKILIEERAFPSDQYAVESQVLYRDLSPDEGIMTAKAGEVERVLESRGEEIAVVLLGGVNYYSGRAFDMKRITRLGHEKGCVVGFDLAHAAGNLELSLHDWNVDFAVWCSYKYLNSGPGSAGGCFVHERHSRDFGRKRLAGWWGNDPSTRFKMPEKFMPQAGAAGWQISNAPVFSMAPSRVSLDIFKKAGMTELRKKSELLTGYLEFLLKENDSKRFSIITPADPRKRGCQLSIRFAEDAAWVFDSLQKQGIVCDFREPDVIRAAPAPLYNTFHEVWSFASHFKQAVNR